MNAFYFECFHQPCGGSDHQAFQSALSKSRAKASASSGDDMGVRACFENGKRGRLARPGRRPADRNGRGLSGEKASFVGSHRHTRSVRRVAGRHRRVACATPVRNSQTRSQRPGPARSRDSALFRAAGSWSRGLPGLVARHLADFFLASACSTAGASNWPRVSGPARISPESPSTRSMKGMDSMA